jgi:hypothetical protein
MLERRLLELSLVPSSPPEPELVERDRAIARDANPNDLAKCEIRVIAAA